MMNVLTALTFLLSFSLHGVQSQRRPVSAACVQGSCYPATGDLLIGRESQLSASSTCGQDRPATYCILSHLVERNASSPLPSPLRDQQCFVCDSTKPYFPSLSPNSHRIENVVSKIPRDRNRWWQSKNGLHNVSILLNLEAEFHFTHLIMTFKTFRPAAMYIERSFNFGSTWRPYRYYSSNCLADFPKVSREPMRKIGDVVCSSDYTDMEPSTGGEVIFRAVPSHLQKINDPYSEEVQELVKLTNLRIVFTRLHTLGDLAFDSRPEVINNYYFALFELNVRGSCSCYGHAERCVPDSRSAVIDNMVYGNCECSHHTTGMNCHKCQPFYNDLPWKPATLESSNECKKCECNQHASRCHFDAAVFKASGGVSGGVCDDCAHNTQGKNCQECQPFFFQDDTLALSSPEICKPCNCDPFGSENRGECEQKTDLAAKTIAGRCICKKNAGGKRCDRCKPGYWNFDGKNPNGCNKCKCYLPGTFKNLGCDQKTGDCTCKRFVTGDTCDKCMPGYFGLAQNVEEGCKACVCSPGGSKSIYCDPVTGACPCKEGMEGRRCDKVSPGYFVPRIDVLIFEAEKKKSGGTGQSIDLYANVTSKPTHTGPGGVVLGSKDTVEIVISPSPPPGMYQVAIRVQPKEFGSRGWPNFRVRLIRPTVPSPNSFCGKRGGKKVETFLVNINATVTTVTVATGAVFIPKSICIGPNETVTIRIEANERTRPNPRAKVIIDSVVLIPDSVSTIKGPPGSTEDPVATWIYCRDLLLSLAPTSLPERCKKLLPRISVAVYEGPKKCRCNPTGSKSSICNPAGGQCRCKPGVEGRSCNRCLDEHFGFSPAGCKPCLCDLRGAHFSQCDPTTGACYCKDNAYGRRCNECKRGFWNFPRCQPCRCNRHTDTCDSITGRCTNCTDFTDGEHCQYCRRGYYGDPKEGRNIPCKPCLCPGGLDSGIDRSVGCILDSRTNTAKCLCQKGYSGKRCERCATNYFGNPLDPQSKCRPCECNGNIDPSVPDSCDSTTGICLKCQHNTEGSNCQECRDGYYGNAAQRECKECACFTFGTKPGPFRCEKKTGQCDCLPNVIGRNCDKCQAFHWNIASKKGCEKCKCDVANSLSPACNEFTGQCKCKPGRGGRTCNECEATYWGKPDSKDGCKKCLCIPSGSKTLQCDRRSGKCVCKPGVTGDTCGRCDRGTLGTFPDCKPCGECWKNWYRNISELLNETRAFQENAGKISGNLNLPKSYLKDLKMLESHLNEIDKKLGSNAITSTDLQKLKDELEKIKNLMKAEKIDQQGLEELQEKLSSNADKEKRTKELKDNLVKKLAMLKDKVDQLEKEAIKIKESNLAGAFQIVKQNKMKSDTAQAKIADVDRQTQDLRDRLNSKRKALEKAKKDLTTKVQNLKLTSLMLKEEIRKLKQNTLPELNKKVCGGKWQIPFTEDPVCHASCGGGGCAGGRCGGSAVCDSGSQDRLRTTEKYLADAERLLKRKNQSLGSLMDQIKELDAATQRTSDKAKEARKEVEKIDALLKMQSGSVKSLLKEMKEVLKNKTTYLEELKNLMDSITKNTPTPIPMNEIEKLEKAIEEKLKKLQNVNKILEDTKKDREATKKLKEDAERLRKEAEKLAKQAQDIADALQKAKKASDETEDEIAKLKQKDKNMGKLLKEITSLNSNSLMSQIKAQVEKQLKELKDRKDNLEREKKTIETKKDKVEEENKRSAKTAAKAKEAMDNRLKPKIADAEQAMEEKKRLMGVSSDRTRNLRDNINKTRDKLKKRLDQLKKKQEEAEGSLNTLNAIKGNLDTLMNDILVIVRKIERKSARSSSC